MESCMYVSNTLFCLLQWRKLLVQQWQGTRFQMDLNTGLLSLVSSSACGQKVMKDTGSLNYPETTFVVEGNYQL